MDFSATRVYTICACSSHQTVLSTRRHAAHPVSALILLERLDASSVVAKLRHRDTTSYCGRISRQCDAMPVNGMVYHSSFVPFPRVLVLRRTYVLFRAFLFRFLLHRDVFCWLFLRPPATFQGNKLYQVCYGVRTYIITP